MSYSGWPWICRLDKNASGHVTLESNYRQQPCSTLKRSAVEYFSIIRTEPWTGDDGKKGHLIPFCFDPRWTHQSHPADWRAGVPKYSGRPVRCCPLHHRSRRRRHRWPLPHSCQTESRTYSLDYATLQCRSCCCFIHKQDFGIIQKTRWTGSGVPSTLYRYPLFLTFTEINNQAMEAVQEQERQALAVINKLIAGNDDGSK